MVNYRSLVPGGFYSSTPFDPKMNVSVRTNNPGALNTAPWIKALPGYVGDKVTSDSSGRGGGVNSTVIFETPEQGVAAWWELMRKYKVSGYTTVQAIVNRYGGGQDYSDYVAFVADYAGLTADTKIDLFNDDKTLLRFAKAMFRYEAGVTTPLHDNQITYGFMLARNGGDQKAPAPVPQSDGWLKLILDWLKLIFAPKAAPPSDDVPPWYAWATKEIGFHEVGENHGIDKYIALAHCGSDGDPWCAIFVNAALEASNVQGSRSAMARSFETNGNFVKLYGPALGAITTMWRGSPSAGTGHVFFYAGEDSNGVLALGGNQSDQVRRQYEPKNRVVGYYWPKNYPLPKKGGFAPSATGEVGGSET